MYEEVVHTYQASMGSYGLLDTVSLIPISGTDKCLFYNFEL
jgi:hypothetical protein